MFEKIENIIVRTLNSLEYETLDSLSKTYSEDEIVAVYKKYGDKPISYIQKVLSSKPKKNVPYWLHQEIVNEELDEETLKECEEFRKFIEEFRNE